LGSVCGSILLGLFGLGLIIVGWGWIALFAIRLLGKMEPSASAPLDADETDAAEHPGHMRTGE